MSGASPSVSVVTVTRNAERHLEENLRSVSNQDRSAWEHIVIDGGSIDGTVEILRRWESHLAFWVSEPDGGIADAFNKGLARARGELVAFLNADDAYEPGALEAVQRVHENDSDAVVYGDVKWLDGERAVRLRPPARRWGLGPYFHFDTPVFHPACFAPRRALEQVGGFDAGLSYAMDYDLLLRLHRAGWRFRYLERMLTRYRGGGAAVSNPMAAWDEVRRAQRRAGLNAPACTAAHWAKRAAHAAVPLPRLKAGLNRLRRVAGTP
jgi:glycosyltransferase involved in cell wall biosynthesis